MKGKLFTGLALFCILCVAAANSPEEKGKGYLGVILKKVPESLSAHIQGAGGALLESVVPDGPADRAGLKRFDLIVSLNGKDMQSIQEVVDTIHGGKPGEKMDVGVIRGTEHITVQVILGAAPVEIPQVLPEPKLKVPEKKEKEPGFLGIGPAEVPPMLSAHLGLKEGKGILVGDVVKGSPAEKAGIEKNDVLVALDGYDIGGTRDFFNLMGERKAGERIKIELIHRGEKKGVEVTLAPRPREIPSLPGLGLDQDRENYWGWSPRIFHRGRIIIRDPDGKEHVIPFPRLPREFWKTEDLFKDLEGKIKELKEIQIPEFKESLRNSLRDIEKKLKSDDAADWSSSDSHTSVIRNVDGEYDITLRDENGVRTVTVLKGGKSIATDLPYDEIHTLPKDVQDRVMVMSKSIKVQKIKKENPRLPRLKLEGKKIRA